MKHLALILIALSLISCKAIETIEPGSEPSLKLVKLDHFMNQSLSKSIPISFLIPEEYEHADIDAPLTYSYWMPRGSVQRVKETKDMPVDTGWLYGKITMSVGYDEKTDKFIGADNLAYQAKIGGFTNVKSERIDIAGYPVLTLEMEHKKTGKTIYSMYIGMKLETNTIYLAYREPQGKKAIGRYVWNNLVESMKSNNGLQ